MTQESYGKLLNTVGKLRNSDNMVRINIKNLELSLINLQHDIDNNNKEKAKNTICEMFQTLERLDRNISKIANGHRKDMQDVLMEIEEVSQ